MLNPQKHHFHPFVAIMMIGLFLFGVAAVCESVAIPTDSPLIPTNTSRPDRTEEPGSSSWVEIFFTQPDPPDNLTDGIDQVVLSDLNSAKKTIDIASFDFNLPEFVEALKAAKGQGVRVRLVLDLEEGNTVLSAGRSPTGEEYDALAALEKAKIPVVDGGRSNGLMHDKIVLIDGKTLYMGSWNLSYNDTFRNNNNLLRITDPELIANYQDKFNEMFEDKLFGANAEVGAAQERLNVEGTQVENYFSPVNEVMDELVSYVREADHSVYFIAFTFTHPDLAEAMIERAKAGVDVQGLFENRGASQGAMPSLYCAGLPVRTDGNKYTMHHKVIVIDEQTLITGSFNFTASADEANDDNVLVIHDPGLAQLYLDEYERLYTNGSPPDPEKYDCSKLK